MAHEVKVLLFRGTGAPPTGDMIMQTYAKGLDDWADIEWINYPASYGTPSYDVSIYEGSKMGFDALRATNKPAIGMGYSQGADVIGYMHALLNRTRPNVRNHDLSNCSISGSFLIADPSRSPEAVNLNGGVGGWGIRGARPIGPNSFGVANSGDPICAYGNGPLRSFADFSAFFGDPDAAIKIRQMVEQKRLQPWWAQPNPMNSFKDWSGSIGWLNNYLGTHHTDQYLTKGYVKMLSDHTNSFVRGTLL